jgi:hypothetical protein
LRDFFSFMGAPVLSSGVEMEEYSRGKNRQARFQSAAAKLGELFHRVIGTLVRLVEPRC